MTAPERPKLLLLEFWGLGDLTFATPLLQAAVKKWDVTLVGKPHAGPLLAATFPTVAFVEFDAPWSVYAGKYHLWTWNWRALLWLVRYLRARHFDAALSVRSDPRDHLLMAMIGARRRYGFPRRGSMVFLTDPIMGSRPKQHRVEDWRDLGRAFGLPAQEPLAPRLEHGNYRTARVDALLAHLPPGKPVLCLHPGARIAVRRWPEPYFDLLVRRLRQRYDFFLLLIPDPDGYGSGLSSLADTVLPALSVDELVDVLGRIDLLLCNDSGPGHIAAACGRPTIVVFGPTDPDWFRPWGKDHHLAIRDICPWRPCFDYCKFSEPHCLTKLLPDSVWPEIREHLEVLLNRGLLPPAFRRAALPVEAAA